MKSSEIEAALAHAGPITIWQGITRCDVVNVVQDPNRYGVKLTLRFSRARAVYVHHALVSAAHLVERREVGERLLAAIDEGFAKLIAGQLRRVG